MYHRLEHFSAGRFLESKNQYTSSMPIILAAPTLRLTDEVEGLIILLPRFSVFTRTVSICDEVNESHC